MESVDIIRLAREAGAVFPADGSWHKFETEENLERFAALVAAEKDKEIKMLAKALKQEQKKNDALISIMSGSTELAVRLAVKAEREECAKVCDEQFGVERIAQECAAAIRSRT